MSRAVFCIVPFLFALGSCTNVVDSVVSNAVSTVTDFLSITNATFASLDFVALAAEDGYSASAHNVTTEDGYILTIFRLTGNDCSSDDSKGPLLLQHGLALTADSWLDAGVDASLAYLLADDCYDLWVGNNRGNYYGRAHTTLDPDVDGEFWEFSLHEIGFYDLPAMIDYILDTTGYSQLNYVGYSQGGGTFFIMNSERPEYNEKINLFIGLAPSSRLQYSTSNLMSLIAGSGPLLSLLPSQGSLREVYFRGSVVQTLAKTLCGLAGVSSQTYETCEILMAYQDSDNKGSMTARTYSRLYYHFIAGVSVKLANHYYQLKSASTFDKYDYGSTQNLDLYGSADVPAYNITATVVPSVIVYGLSDTVIAQGDTDWVQSQLPSLIAYVTVNSSIWNHFDMMYSQHIPTLLYPIVKEYLDL